MYLLIEGVRCPLRTSIDISGGDERPRLHAWTDNYGRAPCVAVH